MNSNIYYHPEAFGLTVVATADCDLGYEFDTFVIWVDAQGTYWWTHDEGCSCPCPFEDKTMANIPSGSLRDALTDLDAWIGEYPADLYRYPYRAKAADTEVIRRLRQEVQA